MVLDFSYPLFIWWAGDVSFSTNDKARLLLISIWSNFIYDYALDGGYDCAWTWKPSDDSYIYTLGDVVSFKNKR